MGRSFCCYLCKTFSFIPLLWDMEGPTVCSKTTHPRKGRLHNTSRRKAKALKASEHKPRFVLGHDVYMDKVETLCRRVLISRLEYCSMSKEGWVDWATLHWTPLIHYAPSISLLENRWLVFVFIEESDASLILDKLWPILDGSLVLKKWHSGFDPLTERVTIRHLWVLLPALPFPLWRRISL